MVSCNSMHISHYLKIKSLVIKTERFHRKKVGSLEELGRSCGGGSPFLLAASSDNRAGPLLFGIVPTSPYWVTPSHYT